MPVTSRGFVNRERWSRRLRLLLRLVGMALLVALFARVFRPEDLTALRGVRGDLVGYILLAHAVAHVLTGLGWQVLLADCGVRVGFWRMVVEDLGSLFWSTVLPGSVVGEAVKGVRLAGGWEHAETVAVCLALARLLGGLAAALGAVALLWPRSDLDPTLKTGLLWLFAATAGASAAMVGLLRVGPDTVRRWWPALASRLPAGRFPSGKALLASTALKALSHVGFAGIYTLSYAAVGTPVPFGDGLAIYVLVSILAMLPVTFGALGVRELTVVGLGEALAPGSAGGAAAVVVTSSIALTLVLAGFTELLRLTRR